jgi:hypothetical protein
VSGVFSKAPLSGKGLNKALALSSKAWSSLAAPAAVPANNATLHTDAAVTEEINHANLRIASLSEKPN